MSVKKVKFINYEGTVTSRNISYCQFILDNKYIVLASDIFEYGKEGLPKINDKIILKNVVILEKNYMHMGKNSKISCSGFEYPEKSIRFCWEYIEKYKFNLQDVELIKKTADRFKKLKVFDLDFIKNKTLFHSVTEDDIFLNIFSFLPKKKIEFINCNYENYEFTLPYKYSSYYPDVNDNDEVEEITYTVQWSNGRQIFVGYLTYDEITFTTVLIDGKYQIKCLIINNQHKPLKKYLDEFIIINKYQYIAEYYKEVSEKIEYIIVNLEDIRVLDLNDKSVDVKPELPKNSCVVLHKCPVYYHNFTRKFEFWLYVEFPKNYNFKCVISTPYFADIYHLIKPGTELRIDIPEDIDLEKCFFGFLYVKNMELKNHGFINIQSYILPPNIKIEINESVNHYIPIYRMEEILPARNSEHYSFSAVVQLKGLSKPLAGGSRTAKYAKKLKMFGTPGTKTPFLRLEGINVKRSDPVVSLYLNNLENSHFALGLIPGMKINVRYTKLQNTYFKSSIITSFEPVEYIPKLRLNTRISFSEDCDWGQPSYISMIEDVPSTARLWGIFDLIQLNQIQYITKCSTCSMRIKRNQNICCNESDFFHKFTFRFRARGARGFVVLNSDKIEVFKTIFGCRDRAMTNIFVVLEGLKEYFYFFTQKFDFDQTEMEDAIEENLKEDIKEEIASKEKFVTKEAIKGEYISGTETNTNFHKKCIDDLLNSEMSSDLTNSETSPDLINSELTPDLKNDIQSTNLINNIDTTDLINTYLNTCNNNRSVEPKKEEDTLDMLNQMMDCYFAGFLKLLRNVDLRVKRTKSHTRYEKWYCFEARRRRDAIVMPLYK